jgi:phosphoenolpyruvate carboxykinase (GTP)
MATMCQPDSIHWCDGGDEERQRLTTQAIKTGELIELNQKKLPDCYLHR